jgi:gas vesicle protein
VTSSPYVPSSGGQDQDPQTSEWTAGSTGAGQPVADPAAPYGQFDEPVTTGYEPAGSTATGGYGQSSTTSATKDTAKGEAADLKNTAVDKGQQVAGVAKEQAAAVKDTAVDKGQQVVGVAKEEASRVTAEATGQVKDLLNQGRSQLTEQVSAQQQKLSSLVHSFADELGTMASKSDKSGPITDLAQQGSRRIGALAHTLETSDASDLLDQVRNFARRRPVAFLLGSALAGVVVGRLSRSLASEAHDAKVANETRALPASTYTPVTTGYETTTPVTTGYETTAPVATGYETGAYTTGTTTGTTGGYETGSYDAGYTATRAYDDTVGGYTEPGQGDLPR